VSVNQVPRTKRNSATQSVNQAAKFAIVGLTISLLQPLYRFYIRPFLGAIFLPIIFLSMFVPGMYPTLSDDKMSASYPDQMSLYVGCVISVIVVALLGFIVVALLGLISVKYDKKYALPKTITCYILAGLIYAPFIFSSFDISNIFQVVKAVIILFGLLFIPFWCSYTLALESRRTSFHEAELQDAQFTRQH
jgi:hypothetical protein